MTRRVIVDGLEIAVRFKEITVGEMELIECTLASAGKEGESCTLSVVEVAPAVYSVLDGTQNYLVRLEAALDGWDVWIGDTKRNLLLIDPRDRTNVHSQGAGSGPFEVRSQMPGKIIRLLVQEGDDVEAGQGIIVVEAMKMQNEVKSPKSAHIEKIYVREGNAVVAGQALFLIA